MKAKTDNTTGLKGPDDFETIGSYVSYVREAKGLTLRDVVELIKTAITKKELDAAGTVSKGYLSNLEAEKYIHPAPLKLKALAHVYNIPYELLLNKAGYWDRTTEKIKKDGSFTLMFKEVQDMTASEKRSVMDYIEFVKSKRKQNDDKGTKKS